MTASIRMKIRDLLRTDFGTVILLSVFTLLVRLITLPVIEDSGDHVFYWTAARKLFQPGCEYFLNHWSSRFGVVFPVFISQMVLGIQPLVFYTVPLLMSVLQTVAIYFVGLHVGGKKIAVPAALVLLLYPTMIRNGSHILPGIFSSTYITLAVLCLYEYLDSEGARLRYIVFSAVLLFAAYETHIICVFVVPGFMLMLLGGEKKLRDLSIFAGVLALLLFIEFVMYYVNTGSLLGQLGIIIHSHVENNESLEPTSLPGLFYRFIRPGPHFTIAFIVYLAACVYFLKKGFPAKIRLLVYSSLSFFFALTFALKSIDPMIPVINSQIRYFDPVLPVFFCIITYFAVLMVYDRSPRPEVYRIGFAVLVIAVVVSYCIYFRGNFTRHSLSVVHRNNTLADMAVAGNIPFVYSLTDSTRYRQFIRISGGFRERQYDRAFLKRYGIDEAEYKGLRRHYTRMNRSFSVLKNIYCDNCISCGGSGDGGGLSLSTAVYDNRTYVVLMTGKNILDRNSYFKNAGNRIILVDRLPTRMRMTTIGRLEEK